MADQLLPDYQLGVADSDHLPAAAADFIAGLLHEGVKVLPQYRVSAGAGRLILDSVEIIENIEGVGLVEKSFLDLTNHLDLNPEYKQALGKAAGLLLEARLEVTP